jgi:DNA-binding NtrC family response regulator
MREVDAYQEQREKALFFHSKGEPVGQQSGKKNLLVIDDDKIYAEAVKDFFDQDSLNVLMAHTAKEGLAVCSQQTIDIVLLDQQLPDAEGHTLCPEILKCNEQAKIIFATAYPSFENAVTAIKQGAYDYLAKPFELEALRLAISQATRTLDLERFEQLQDYRRTRESEETVFIGGEGLTEIMKMKELAADSDSPVLITGETGTGKTMLAKTIHYRSARNSAPFISINCAALPESLIEAELFGYEKGAFTGAATARKGIFEMAEGGTLFLDEIGEMPPHLQAKLLSVIDDKLVRKIGGASTRPVNVRVIAATGIDLAGMIGKTFRKDLFYRLSVLQIHLPPLRERKKDIPGLCAYLLGTLGVSKETTFPQEEYSRLMAYDWPGNVRELKNILERAVMLQRGIDLMPSLLLEQKKQAMSPVGVYQANPLEILPLDEVEKKHIRFTLEQFGSNYTKTARALGISLSTLKRKIKTIF